MTVCRLLRRAAALAPVVSLAACVPAHKSPPAAAAVTTPAQWRQAAQQQGQIDAQWWRSFNDPLLTGLVEAALQHNTDVMSAMARVDEAREQARLARSALLPEVDLSVPGQAARTLGTTGVAKSTSYQPELQVAYELDLRGRLRLQRQAARLQYAATQADRDTVMLSIAANTARAYIGLLSLDAQLEITRNTLESRRQALQVAEDRARVGYTSQLELTQAQSEYEATAQVVPQLELAVRQQENALRLLTGDLPGAVARKASFGTLKPPAVPVGLPSELLRRRPDLAAAELNLAAADAGIGAARAAFLPQVQLSAGAGRLYVDALDYDPVRVWDIGASILAPLFSGGRLSAQLGVATAQRDQAAYAYRDAVLTAFGEVENALTGIDRLGQQIDHARRRRNILIRSLQVAQDRYRGGYSSYIDELDAQRNLFDTELSAVQLRETQLNNVVSLYQALGGGWNPALHGS